MGGVVDPGVDVVVKVVGVVERVVDVMVTVVVFDGFPVDVVGVRMLVVVDDVPSSPLPLPVPCPLGPP